MSETGSLQPTKVLLMDDDARVRSTTEGMLRRLGYDVVLASDGAEAVALYEQLLAAGDPVAVAILDLVVPGGLGGDQAAARILDIHPDARLVLVSGSLDHPAMADHEAYGFVASLAKPFAVAALGLLIGELLD